jgi:hypothetical protein
MEKVEITSIPTDLTNVIDLRKVLCEEIKRLRSGETTPSALNAIVNASGKIISSVKLELEYNKAVGLSPDIKFISNDKIDGQKKSLEDSR